ncbi:phosphoglucomutase/phosphomannomutase family protein [Geoalkalibacter halelectricus]|uniref:Phosphoglucomutase/phosphomannomutase family protein n=1 Tax=Geoalkalibacter halelectricus TaxID=2847045 RepID=A0ABY5ZMZ8_9BACT|nr:phosphoglucomutase/phosphomannomutase family protein [Geoalkalibacter halelectricus]MDO3378451.1 phosphoglucomutase/phosphomannomutase family protein [Geoalkalibacter halelectricus]UWZ80229.1 phosphoglucomutase/phosphomannomutase family protein [Geoalkalibacter halelectricus]
MSAPCFGTDGWRGIIARDFTFARVAEVTAAIIAYLEEEGLAGRGLVVGFDRRFQSQAFAAEVAEIAAQRGLHVWLTRQFVPSPAVSWAVREKNAGAGIIVTASHNPPQYNGLKLKEFFGGSARPAVTARIEALLRGATAPQPRPRGRIEVFDGLDGYRRKLAQSIQPETLRRARRALALDVMHGAAAGVLAPLLEQAGFTLLELRGDENPAFDGHAPNPSADHLGGLMEVVASGQAALGLAVDGDGDRLAAVDEQGRYCGPQVLFPLLLRYLSEIRGRRGRVIKSVSTTHLVDRICRAQRLPLSETAIGFKHACQAILDDEVLMAGEESGAPGVPLHLPDRDAQLATLLLLEAIGATGGTLSALNDGLQEQFGPLHYRQDRLALPSMHCAAMQRRIAALAPPTLCGLPVRSTNRIDGVKWLLDDDAWLLIRVSGTEPLARLYAEAPDAALAEELLGCGRKLLGHESAQE